MSDINYEQRCVIKFCIKLGYSATETFTKLTKVYGIKLCQEHRFSDGIKHFQMAGNQLRMIHALEDCQRQELTTMLIESGTRCGLNIG